MKPTYFLACALAVIAIAGCDAKQGNAATNAPVDAKPVPPPKGGDWSAIVTATPEGGFRMGNPNAALKLIEYGSLTCPHCREFDEQGAEPLITKYVKTGQLSWEFRNYVRDAFDLTASLIARCNGAKSFFPLSRALYKDQMVWVGKVQATPPEQIEQLQNLPPDRQFVELAKVAGFQDWAAARGVPVAKSNQCLGDENAVNNLVQMTSDVTSQYPDFQGTPSFVLNGKLLDKTASWSALEPQIRAAMGERG
jgi:protein-disulfide isomerase